MSSAWSVGSDWSGAAVDRDGDRRGIRGWWRGGAQVGRVGAEGVEELACDVALEAADDLALGLALGEASLGGSGWRRRARRRRRRCGGGRCLAGGDEQLAGVAGGDGKQLCGA